MLLIFSIRPTCPYSGDNKTDTSSTSVTFISKEADVSLRVVIYQPIITKAVTHLLLMNPPPQEHEDSKYRARFVLDVVLEALTLILAATKQLCEWSFPSVCLSLSVTPFSLCFHHRIILKFSGVITHDKCDVHAKGQGHICHDPT